MIVVRIGVVAGAVVGLQALLPAALGAVSVAAVWAVSPGIFLLPVALYARHRLAARDSPRLSSVKRLMDGAVGAFIGAAIVAGVFASPSLGLLLAVKQLAFAGLPLASLAVGRALSNVTTLPDSAGTYAILAILPGLLGATAAGPIGLVPVLGMLALAAMTTISFCLGRIIAAAESGRPFSVPGSIQKMRFPVSQWVMLGVIFATWSGLKEVYANQVFWAWQILGSRTFAWQKDAPLWKNLVYNLANFNVLYAGLLAFVIVTFFMAGALSPLTFLALAFAPERAALAAEALLGKLLPKSEPAPSTGVEPVADPSTTADEPVKRPQFHYWLKTLSAVASIAVLGLCLGTWAYTWKNFAKTFGMASLMAIGQFFGSKYLIKRLMNTTPADEKNKDDQKVFAVRNDLMRRINDGRVRRGKKPIDDAHRPELVDDPNLLPNAYATGWGPSHALIGVTKGIKLMLLDPENLRQGLLRLMASCDAETKAFKLFRAAIAGSLGKDRIPPEASPSQVAEAVQSAPAEALDLLGVRVLRGVMAHELNHVMDWHMAIGAAAGAFTSALSMASWSAMWLVGKFKDLPKKLEAWAAEPRPFTPIDRVKTWGLQSAQAVAEPVSVVVVGGAIAVLAVIKAFAIVWGPLAAILLQMASSRADEGMADEDGAKLSGDPEALGLGLGLLMTWQPPKGFQVDNLAVIALNAHRYTVNPLEQMRNAGVLPRLSRLAEALAGGSDDFFFNLFVTHPDTLLRIMRLRDMMSRIDRLSGKSVDAGRLKP